MYYMYSGNSATLSFVCNLKEMIMEWLSWLSGSHHGKTRTMSSGGKSKTEGYVGKSDSPFTTHFSTKTNSSGRKTAHAGRHTDKKK